MEDADQVFAERTQFVFFGLFNPAANLNFPKIKIAENKTNDEESPFMEFSSPVCNYKLKEDINDDDDKRKRLVDDIFGNLMNFDDTVEPPQYYPVKIVKAQNKNTNLSESSSVISRDAKSVISRKKDGPSKKEQIEASKLVDVLERRESKKKKEEEELNGMTEEEREKYIEKKNEERKRKKEALRQSKAKHDKEKDEKLQREKKKQDGIDKVTFEREKRLEEYKKSHPYLETSPRRNSKPFY